MLQVPEKIFNADLKSVDLGLSDILIFEKDEIEKEQIGYRYTGLPGEGEPIEDWIGEDYVVIGLDSCCGDPIIAKVDEDELPIYFMHHDDWSSLQLIATSFEQFINLLKKLDKTNLANKEECEHTFEIIKRESPNISLDYWESLISSGYEFLTGNDYYT